MSFCCEVCGKAQPPRTSPVMIVTERRAVNYPERKKKDGKTVIDNGGQGSETVSEVRACEKCVGEQTA